MTMETDPPATPAAQPPPPAENPPETTPNDARTEFQYEVSLRFEIQTTQAEQDPNDYLLPYLTQLFTAHYEKVTIPSFDKTKTIRAGNNFPEDRDQYFLIGIDQGATKTWIDCIFNVMTPLRFAALKTPLIPWLKQSVAWMELSHMGMTLCQRRIGFIAMTHPLATNPAAIEAAIVRGILKIPESEGIPDNEVPPFRVHRTEISHKTVIDGKPYTVTTKILGIWTTNDHRRELTDSIAALPKLPGTFLPASLLKDDNARTGLFNALYEHDTKFGRQSVIKVHHLLDQDLDFAGKFPNGQSTLRKYFDQAKDTKGNPLFQEFHATVNQQMAVTRSYVVAKTNLSTARSFLTNALNMLINQKLKLDKDRATATYPVVENPKNGPAVSQSASLHDKYTNATINQNALNRRPKPQRRKPPVKFVLTSKSDSSVVSPIPSATAPIPQRTEEQTVVTNQTSDTTLSTLTMQVEGLQRVQEQFQEELRATQVKHLKQIQELQQELNSTQQAQKELLQEQANRHTENCQQQNETNLALAAIMKQLNKIESNLPTKDTTESPERKRTKTTNESNTQDILMTDSNEEQAMLPPDDDIEIPQVESPPRVLTGVNSTPRPDSDPITPDSSNSYRARAFKAKDLPDPQSKPPMKQPTSVMTRAKLARQTQKGASLTKGERSGKK